jgi:hypothetical protein
LKLQQEIVPLERTAQFPLRWMASVSEGTVTGPAPMPDPQQATNPDASRAQVDRVGAISTGGLRTAAAARSQPLAVGEMVTGRAVTGLRAQLRGQS